MEPFDVEPEPEPETEPAGVLEPPRRRPPTAVGVGKLPPNRPRQPEDGEPVPEDDGTPYRAGPSKVRCIALRLLAANTLAASAVLLWPLGWRACAGAAVLTLAEGAWHRASRREAPAPVAGCSPERRPPGDSQLRSA